MYTIDYQVFMTQAFLQNYYVQLVTALDDLTFVPKAKINELVKLLEVTHLFTQINYVYCSQHHFCYCRLLLPTCSAIVRYHELAESKEGVFFPFMAERVLLEILPLPLDRSSVGTTELAESMQGAVAFATIVDKPFSIIGLVGIDWQAVEIYFLL